jgi:hypothetical protein
MIKRFLSENPNFDFKKFRDDNKNIVERHKLDNNKKIILYLLKHNNFLKKNNKLLNKKFQFENNIYLFNNNKEEIIKNIKTDLVILVPVWKRNDILVKCMNDLLKKGLKERIIYLVSNDTDLELVREKNVYYSYSPNNPLGRKFNNLVRLVKNIECKYFMILGSDDTLPDDYIEKSLLLLEKKNYSMVGTDTQIIHHKKSVYKRNYVNHYNITFGSGRIYRKDLCIHFNYKLFDNNINKAIDRSITEKMKNNNLSMGVVDSKIISYYCNKNSITKFREMFIRSNNIIKIK